jgi:hypothetical protein
VAGRPVSPAQGGNLNEKVKFTTISKVIKKAIQLKKLSKSLKNNTIKCNMRAAGETTVRLLQGWGGNVN